MDLMELNDGKKITLAACPALFHNNTSGQSPAQLFSHLSSLGQKALLKALNRFSVVLWVIQREKLNE